jgi:CDGSH-type Zn-finger protein
MSVKLVKNGPCLVPAVIPLDQVEIMTDDEGYALRYRTVRKFPVKGSYALCRCGKTKTPPFCDGAHSTAQKPSRDEVPRAKTLFKNLAKRFPGPELTLKDAEEFCAGAGFCSRKEGTWEAVRRSDEPRMKKMALDQVNNCCGGRLETTETATGRNPIPARKKAISLVEDPGDGVSGPIWLKGGIRVISSDGSPYEQRENVSLCRCGGSRFKPFCDGRHSPLRFRTVRKRRKR